MKSIATFALLLLTAAPAAAADHVLPVLLGELSSIRVIDTDTAQVHTSRAFTPPLRAGERADLGGGRYAIRLERTDGKWDRIHFSTGFCNALVVEVTLIGFDGIRRSQRFSLDDCLGGVDARYPDDAAFDGYFAVDISGPGGHDDFDRAAAQVEAVAGAAGATAQRTGFFADEAGFYGVLVVRDHPASTDHFADGLPSWMQVVETRSRRLVLTVAAPVEEAPPEVIEQPRILPRTGVVTVPSAELQTVTFER